MAMDVRSDEHPVEAFWRWLREHLPPESHPEGELVPLGNRRVPGVAAFPASHGLYAPCGSDPNELPPFPFGGLMAVGNHLDSVVKLDKRITERKPHGDPCPGADRMDFWEVLYRLLDDAEVPRDELFATNAHPALRPGTATTGRIRRSAPGYDHWEERCLTFMRGQLQVMQPRVVLAMGRPAGRFLGTLFGADVGSGPELHDIRHEGGTATLAVVAHPSARPVTVHARAYEGAEGRSADARLLADAWWQEI